MKRIFILALLLPLQAADFDRDREAILAMAGNFEVDFHFEETVALDPEYQLHKPYHETARERVEVVEDTGKSITLQHLLVVGKGGGKHGVIKHWAQIWRYEDDTALTYEGDRTWTPVRLSPGEATGTWTQYVTQTDDSPRYKAAGKWTHDGNFSVWISMDSTRPLPRRDYTKRKDYDRLAVVNRHLITPAGWVHLQDNRKVVTREGKNLSLCLETGINRYTRVAPEDDAAFQAAVDFWKERSAFWNDVRNTWAGILDSADAPVSYRGRLDGETLSEHIVSLEEEQVLDGKAVSRELIAAGIARYLVRR